MSRRATLPPEQVRIKALFVRVTPGEHEALVRWAGEDGVTVADLVRRAVSVYRERKRGEMAMRDIDVVASLLT